MAARGVSRSTVDQDLLVTDVRVLQADFWTSVGAVLDARSGDASDPLAGVVRLTADGERPVDVVVGTGAWMGEILARTPTVAVQQRMRHLADDVEAVVVSLPPDDTAFGWDYPALRAWLKARQLPHACLHHDPAVPLGAADHERLATLVAAAVPPVGARHG